MIVLSNITVTVKKIQLCLNTNLCVLVTAILLARMCDTVLSRMCENDLK